MAEAGRRLCHRNQIYRCQWCAGCNYFNPKSIRVAKAEVSRDDGEMKVFIELRDVNYPGSIYSLTYDPAGDQLKGIYYQAVEKQRFEVAFVRMK